MRIEVQRNDLSRILTAIGRVVETSSAVPILKNVVLSAADGVLTARGTDLNIEVTATCPCVGDDGIACVPAKNLSDIVKRLAGEVVSLEFVAGSVEDTGDVIVKSGRTRVKLPSVPSKWFPSLATKEYSHRFTADLSKLFAPVMASVLPDGDERQFLCGVYMHTTDRLVAVGADGPRMAIYSADLPAGAEGMPGIIIPTKVASLGAGFKAPVDVSVGVNRIRIQGPDTEICAKLVEGTFPAYARHIPTSNDRTVRVDKTALAQAAGRVGVVAVEASGKAIRLNVAPGSIELVAHDKDGREAVDEIQVEFEGEPTWVAFNVDFLTDMLASAPGDQVEFDITNNTTTTRIRSSSDESFVGVLTPFRMAA